jgi:hypothetical protein
LAQRDLLGARQKGVFAYGAKVLPDGVGGVVARWLPIRRALTTRSRAFVLYGIYIWFYFVRMTLADIVGFKHFESLF